MRNHKNETWVLAFDASCCQCRQLAGRVRQTAGSKVDVRSLVQAEVIEWRRRAYGEDAPWAPTLLRVTGSGVRAWTGLAMIVRLAARIGPRAAFRLLSSFGDLVRSARSTEESRPPSGIGRGQFLRITGLAGVAAVAATLGGRPSPAGASPRPLTPAQEWVRANKDNLPTRYGDFVTHDISHRRAIFGELPARTRSELWVAHLREYVTAHPKLTDEQRRVLDAATRLASREATFAGALPDSAHQQHEEIREAALKVFGLDEARRALATLGPEGDTVQGECDCSCLSPYCVNCFGFYGHCCDQCYTSGCWCGCTSGGCGNLWVYSCEGTC